MDLPLGCMISEKQVQKVCILKKTLYGLKQYFGYHQSNSDHTLFLKKQHGKITTLIVYVDNMMVIGNYPEEREIL